MKNKMRIGLINFFLILGTVAFSQQKSGEIIIYGHSIIKGVKGDEIFNQKGESILITDVIRPIQIETENDLGFVIENMECRFVVIETDGNRFLYNLQKHRVEDKIPPGIDIEVEVSESSYRIFCDDSDDEVGFSRIITKNKNEKLYEFGEVINQYQFSKKDFRVVLKGKYFDVFIRYKKFGVLAKTGEELIDPKFEKVKVEDWNSLILIVSIDDKSYEINIKTGERIEIKN